MTVRQIIDAAIRKLGARAVGDVTTTDEYTDSLQALNDMLDNWAAEAFTVPMMVNEEFPLPAGASSRTMGVGGNFNTSRPLVIDHAHVRDSQGQDEPMDIITWEEYQGISDKASTGRPSQIVSRPTSATLATLYFHPVPDVAYTLFLDSQKPFGTILTVDQDVTLSPEYHRVLVYNLAVELAPDFGENLRADVVAIAHRSKKNVRRINAAARCNKVPLPSGLEVW
jgi:hypothetical protein